MPEYSNTIFMFVKNIYLGGKNLHNMKAGFVMIGVEFYLRR